MNLAVYQMGSVYFALLGKMEIAVLIQKAVQNLLLALDYQCLQTVIPGLTLKVDQTQEHEVDSALEKKARAGQMPVFDRTGLYEEQRKHQMDFLYPCFAVQKVAQV